MNKLKSYFSTEQSESYNEEIFTEFSKATSLSWSTRIKLFAACFLLGAFFSILASCMLFMINGRILFGVLYTLGNVLSISSTCFLMGPFKQIKRMFENTRIFATILVLVMLVLTLVCALALNNGALTIVCCVVQFLALCWYSLSYIPYASDPAVYLSMEDVGSMSGEWRVNNKQDVRS